MPWARFEDDYLGNRKLATLPTVAIALDVAGIMYSARELRDGWLSAADVQVVAALIHLRRWTDAAADLVRVERWAVVEGGGYQIHDYLVYQPSRAAVLADRAAGRDRKRRSRAANGHYVSQRDSGRSPPGFSEESARSHNAPVPGPGPGPECPVNEHPEEPPNPPFAKGGRSRSRATKVEFDESGPRYEQRLGADGKREWVEAQSRA